MATQPVDREDAISGPASPEHDAFVSEKVAKGLVQSRDRAALIPLEQAWRDLDLARQAHSAGI